MKNFFKSLFGRKDKEHSMAKDAIRQLSEQYKPKTISYYIPKSPDDLQVFQLKGTTDGNDITITERREGTGYRISISDSRGVLLFSSIESKCFTKLGISILTGIREDQFFQDFRESLPGDRLIKEILDSMEDRDKLICIDENHWKITRAYESGDKKWAEFVIWDDLTWISQYVVSINRGRDTRSFYPAKEYHANYPHKILKEKLKAPVSKKLF